VPFMDITGIQTLEDVMAKLHKRGVKVMLCGANPRVFAKLQAAGLFSNASPASHCESLRDALLRAGVGRAGLMPAE
jgi:sulfate permease, SulP family